MTAREATMLDSTKKPVHPTSDGVENFRRWFEGSKVVNAHGAPQVVYHGTNQSFDSFDPEKAGQKDSGWYGIGYYLTADPETASAYAEYDEPRDGSPSLGANVMPVYVCLKNPYYWGAGRRAATTSDEARSLTEELIAAGYDGVIVSNEYQAPEYAALHEVVAFDAAQIKSAMGNSGLFCAQTASLSDGPMTLDLRVDFGKQPARSVLLMAGLERQPENDASSQRAVRHG